MTCSHLSHAQTSSPLLHILGFQPLILQMTFPNTTATLCVILFAIISLALAQSDIDGDISHSSTTNLTEPQPGHLFWVCATFLERDDFSPLVPLERYAAAFWVRQAVERLITTRNGAHMASIDAAIELSADTTGDLPLEVRESAEGRTLNITIGALLAQRVLRQHASSLCRLTQEQSKDGGLDSPSATLNLEVRIGYAKIYGSTQRSLRLAEQVWRQTSQSVNAFVQNWLLSAVRDRLVASPSSSAPHMARTTMK